MVTFIRFYFLNNYTQGMRQKDRYFEPERLKTI